MTLDTVVRRLTVASTAIALSVAAADAQSPFWATLRSGPLPVGFRILDTVDLTRSFPASNGDVVPRPMRLYFWYPAAARTGEPMTLRDLVPETFPYGPPDDVKAFGRTLVRIRSGLPNDSLTDAGADSLLSGRLLSRRNAPAAKGRFPVVLLAPGQPISMPVSAELLASDGIVVIGVARKDDQSYESLLFTPNPASIAAESDDLAFALAVARGYRSADATRVGLLGYSSSGLSNLAFAFRSHAPRAIAVFEGWEGWQEGHRVATTLPGFDARGFRAAYLYLEKTRQEAAPDFAKTSAFFDEMIYAPRWRVAFDDATHADFASLGVAVPRAPETLRRNFAAANEMLRSFMTAQLATKTTRTAVWSPASNQPWIHATSYPAREPVPTNQEFFHLAETDPVAADELAQRLAMQPTPIVPFTRASLSRLALLTSSRRPNDSARLYGIVARAFPTSAAAVAGISDALTAAGKTAESRDAARRALALIDADSLLSASQRQSLRQRLAPRATP